jgi:hypothetical protein
VGGAIVVVEEDLAEAGSRTLLPDLLKGGGQTNGHVPLRSDYVLLFKQN